MLQPGLYRHFKGQTYYLLTIGQHTETHEPMVVYCAKDDTAKWWIRPLEMWSQEVEWPDGVRRPRFVYLGSVAESVRQSEEV